MSLDRTNPRNPGADIDSMFVDRWSPRAFEPTSLTEDEIMSLFEAARWAPSCYNEQPWLFLYATAEMDRERFLPALVDANQTWAKRAPLLLFLACKKHFKANGNENRHAPFDAGSAWMSLALQARKLGLYAHAMAGFSKEKAYEILQLPSKDYDIMAAIAIGRRAEPGILAEKTAKMEVPSDRKPLEEVVREGGY